MDLYRTLFKLVKKVGDHAKTVQILANQDLSQLEFLYDFQVAVLQPLCCVESTCTFQMNVYLSLAIPILCRCGIIVG